MRYLTIGLAALLLASLVGCRSAPIKNVDLAPVPPSATQKQVQKAILDAGASQGWVMKVKYPGLIVGTLSVRSHMAGVEIEYSRSAYSIRYRSSSNLDYDPANRSIHSNYNRWIENLDSAIRSRVVLL